MNFRLIASFIVLPSLVLAQANRLADEVSKLGAKPLVIEKTPTTPRVLAEAEEVARLQAIEGRRIPIQQSPLGEAITVVATAAEMNFVAPPQAEFPEAVTISFQGNPYELLQILGDQYRFTMTYRRGVWIFTRESAGAQIGKVYRLKYTNLEPVKVGQNTVVSFGKVDGTGSSGSGSSSGNSTGSGLVFESQESRLVKDIQNILGISKSPTFLYVKPGDAVPMEGDTRALVPTQSRNQEGGRVVVIPSTNSVLVVCTRSQHEVIREYIESVDHPVRQVHLAAQFVSTSYNPALIVGIDPSKFQPNLNLSNLTKTIDLNKIKSIRAPENAVLSADTLSLQMNLLQQDSHSRLEQKASTVSADDSEAALAVVTEIPYVDSNTTGSLVVNGGLGTTQSSVAYRRVGVLINTKMKIFDGGPGDEPRIRLNLKITVSELTGFIPTGSTTSPETSNREYTQTVEVPNGYTLALGGLNSEELKDGTKKVPILGNIPVIGYLFGSKNKSKDLRSLIAYITPTIVNESELLKSTQKVAISKASEEAVLPLR